jgi:hypothetical protein
MDLRRSGAPRIAAGKTPISLMTPRNLQHVIASGRVLGGKTKEAHMGDLGAKKDCDGRT